MDGSAANAGKAYNSCNSTLGAGKRFTEDTSKGASMEAIDTSKTANSRVVGT